MSEQTEGSMVTHTEGELWELIDAALGKCGLRDIDEWYEKCDEYDCGPCCAQNDTYSGDFAGIDMWLWLMGKSWREVRAEPDGQT